MDSCLFCSIIRGELHSEVIYQDELSVAFRDINPQAPVHVLIVPREHVVSLAEATAEDERLLGHLLRVATALAEKEGILTRGYRTVINTNKEAGQSVYHIHVHLLGGRYMGWPPG